MIFDHYFSFFMMSVVTLSLPQFVMLKRVMKKELMASYALIIASVTTALVFAFNAIF